MNLALYSHAAGGVAFALLSVLFLVNWRGRPAGGLLLLASVITMVWAIVFAIEADGRGVPEGLLWTAELLRAGTWIALPAYLLLALIPEETAGRRDVRRLAVGAAVGVVILTAMAIAAEWGPRGVVTKLGIDLRLAGHAGLAVIGLILIEQLYRNTRVEQRWAIKYLCIGVGGMFAYDFFLFTDAMLFKRIDPGLFAARGAVLALMVPLIAVSAARNPDWSVEVFVSRGVVFHSATLLAAGSYLVVMAAVGYYLREQGGEWGTALQALFLAGAFVVLMALLFSGQWRAQLRLLLNKHFFNYRYDYREEWLRLTNTLAGVDSSQPIYRRVAAALAQIVQSPGAWVWTVDEHGFFRPRDGWAMDAGRFEALTGDDAMVRFLREREWVVVLPERSVQPESYAGLVLPPWLEQLEAAWLIVPLLHREDLTGFVLLAAPQPAIHLNWEDLELLRMSGRQCAIHLVEAEAAEALGAARQFEGFNRLAAFVIHDLKNVVAQLALVVRNAERHRDNPAFVDDALGTVGNAVARMKRLLAQLREARPVTPDSAVELEPLVGEVVAECAASEPVPALQGDLAGAVVRADRDRLHSVLGHLIHNAQDAAGARGTVGVVLASRANRATVSVIDDGAGMDEEFIRDRLFKPFDSTKGLTGMGIGAYESREFIHALGGRLHVESRPGKGTTMTIEIPVEWASAATGADA
ncbi:MAG: PEP-CTERM system histidine kinase PrsK [Chromatiales bacterium]|nr:PEP-CTERM system histidine kinase PrsK [Chromatiales bacterium]